MEKARNAHIDWARENDLMVDEVLASDEFNHLSKEQAKEIIEFVRTISIVFYSLYKKQYEPDLEFKDNETNKNYEPIKNAA